MNDFIILGALRKRMLFLFILASVVLLSFMAAWLYSTPLQGIPTPAVRQLGSGWFYEDGSNRSSLPPLPCHLDFNSDTLYLSHTLSDVQQYPNDVLAIQTRYQSIRVWADETLIYEAAQGQEHALSSMWHFIPSEQYSGATALRIELTKYDGQGDWQLFPILQDHPAAVGMYLLKSYLPTLLVWLCCMMFTLLLAFIVVFMAIRKLSGIPLILSLAAFIFLSGSWILLDSKITTVLGGNYALAYFFSYCVFYLLPIPLLFYFQLIMQLNSKLLRYLIWITVGNAGVWMLLHLLGVIPIQNTATSVHLIIVIFLAVFIREFFKKREERRKKRLVYTFWSLFLIFATALTSIVLYHVGLLPPTNSAVLFVWSLLVLILCMTMDTVVMFGRVWTEKQYIQVYRQLATEDSMTKLANRNAYELRLQALVAHPPSVVSILLFDIDHMKRINDTYGHHTGDMVIYLVAQCIHDIFGPVGDCYRIGGDEFCVILTALCDLPLKFQEFDDLVQQRNKNDFEIAVSYGWETRHFEEETSTTFNAIMDQKTAADRNLYRNKKAHVQKRIYE